MSLFPDESDRFEHASGWEWWLGNGLGGWASSSSSGALSRKYHALLSVAHPSMAERRILLGKLEETALAGSQVIPLSTNYYPGAVHPAGWKNIERFLFDGAAARWTYRIAERRLAKEVWCDRSRPATYIRYTLLEGDPMGLEVVPLVSGRAADSLGLPDAMRSNPGGTLRPDGVQWNHPLQWGLQIQGGLLRPKPDIYHNMQYPRERERGEGYEEDWATPGRFECMLREGHHALICAWANPDATATLPLLDSMADPEEASRRLNRVVDEFRAYNQWGEIPALEKLVRASDSFLVQDRSHFNILAGYPYFGIWARDALISLPGICIYTGRHALARDILDGWIGALKDGLLPNRYDERGRPAFESADGALWLFWALGHLDSEGAMIAPFLTQHWPALSTTLKHWIAGTTATRMESDGLISLRGERLTWMDAAVDGRAITPRAGKRVEINALWLNALSYSIDWAKRMGDSESADLFYETYSHAHGAMDKFYHDDSHLLYDGIDPIDTSLRPNQLWAIALHRVSLSPVQSRRALGALIHSLWLDGAGVRTLAPSDPNYHPEFSGDASQRDEAYHQGAVWPWLCGAWTESWLRLYPNRVEELHRQMLAVIQSRPPGSILGVSEVRDPTTGADGGCPSQAWSVGECMRACVLLERARRWHGASAILAPDLMDITAPLRRK